MENTENTRNMARMPMRIRAVWTGVTRIRERNIVVMTPIVG